MKAVIRRSALALTLCLSVVLIFQNCSNKGFKLTEASVAGSSPAGTDVNLPSITSSANSLISAKSAGVFDTNCLNSNSYDACIFWKNPVAQRGSAYASLLSFGADLASEQKFGVKLTNLVNSNHLESNHLYVYTSLTSEVYQLSDMLAKPRLTLNNGQYRGNYSQDGSDSAGAKSVAQLMAYFWLNHMEQDYSSRAGAAYSNLQAMTYVDAYARDATDTSLIENAFFTFTYNSSTLTPNLRYIYMGYNPSTTTCEVRNSAQQCTRYAPAHEMALSAEVYLHEMGHGNFLQAAKASAVLNDGNNQYYVYEVSKCTHGTTSTADELAYIRATYDSQFDLTNNNLLKLDNAQFTSLSNYCNTGDTAGFSYTGYGSFCKTANGCIDGINEGQADFHYIMMFPEKAQLGETIENNLNGGLESYNASRDVTSATAKSMSTSQFYSLAAAFAAQLGTIGGEIHGMGSAYASILWEIYNDPRIDKRKFEFAFFTHLASLTSSSNYSTAWAALRAAYLVNPGTVSSDAAAIDEVFTRKGVSR